MKKVIFLSVFVFLSACTQKEYHIVREEVRSPQNTQFQQPIGLPEYILQTPDIAQSSPSPASVEYVSAEQMLPSSYSETVTEQVSYLPIDQVTYTYPKEYVYSSVQSTEPAPYVIAEETTSYTEKTDSSIEVPAQPVFDPASTITPKVQVSLPTSDPLMAVVLQHPENRDLVKCDASNTVCLQQYEQQGYVRLRNAPRFAGFKELPTESDYPQGSQWRDSNNIPRW